MRWQGGRRGGDVEDRRGLHPAVAIGGGGGGVAIIAALAYYFLGISPSTTQAIVSQFGGAGSAAVQGQIGSPQDDAGRFVDIVGANINDVWAAKISGYPKPKVVLYDDATPTGCGAGQAAMGPFYCPNDSTVYLDLSFWDELSKLGGSKADFSKAYVLAHEFGHHVQTVTGASAKVQQAERAAASRGEANKYSVALELQADCYAGVWAKSAASVSNGEVAVEPGDLAEGLKSANAIGDDTLQRRGGGRVSPENFTHGSSAQRVEWLQRGYDSGDPRVCEGTFSGL